MPYFYFTYFIIFIARHLQGTFPKKGFFPKFCYSNSSLSSFDEIPGILNNLGLLDFCTNTAYFVNGYGFNKELIDFVPSYGHERGDFFNFVQS